jgi:hypothetical protein
VPLGDLGDMSALDAETALAPKDVEQFRPLMQKYDAGSVAVIYASLLDGGETAPARLNIAIFRYGSAEEVTSVSAFEAGENESLDALLLRAAGSIADRMREDWKRRTAVRFGEEAQLSARVGYEGLEEWLEIRRRLRDVPSIARVEISAITTIDAQVTLHFLGEIGHLNAALAAHDLRLEDRQGYWYLLRTDVAAPERPAEAPKAAAPEAQAPSAPATAPAKASE